MLTCAGIELYVVSGGGGGVVLICVILSSCATTNNNHYYYCCDYYYCYAVKIMTADVWGMVGSGGMYEGKGEGGRKER